MTGDGGFPDLIRDESPWPGLGVVNGAHLRVWRHQPGRLTAVISGLGAWTDADAVARLRAEYPGDTVEVFHHHPGDWITMAFYAALRAADDGSVARSRLFGDELAARLGPSLYVTEDPEDESGGYGGP
ncbi:hypothetical protein ABZ079_17240 [Streptomyces sp. NPDC006314]|uniref:hypothetical protein n=1 Tax=Streptomyces sp. NPDC006314 TaxID=3154475 RepID=UPI0033B352C8